MSQTARKLVETFFAALSSGNMPDDLLTPDMTAWTTLSGSTDKAGYQGMVKLLGTLCARPLTFSIRSVTAEEDRIAVEADSEGTLINGEEYRNTYVFILRVRDGRIASVAEHFNAIIVKEKMTPLMQNRAR